MNRRRMNGYLLTALVAALALSFSLAAAERVSETRSISGDARIRVENTAGKVVVTVWDKNEISIVADLGDEAEELEISATSTGLQLVVVNRSTHFDMDGTDIELKVPAGVSLDIAGVSADIEVDGVNGAHQRLETVSGDIDIISDTPRIEAQTVSGDIEYSGASSRCQMESVSGDIAVSGAGGEVTINTVSGEVSLTDSNIERGRFEAVSGDLELEVSVADSGHLTAANMSGDILLQLPRDQPLEITAQTFSGDISSDFGTVGRVSHGPGSALEYTSPDGGPTIRLESFSGDIKLRSR